MGKKLIIKGADFSENGIFVNLLPTWTNSKAYVSDSSSATFGQLSNSSQFKASDKIELPAGVGSIKYTRPVYTTSAGYKSGFGLVFWDATNTAISGDDIPKGDRDVQVVTISIPASAKYVSFTYFMDTEVEFFASPLL
jgi:hypothetical protein